jgi:hypothetical protein
MIKLFRNIRSKLLQENRISRYFLYAIGEIFLVVIGILIALQINNWNEERIVRNEESVYLQRLLDEMVLDSTRLESTIRLSQFKLDASYFILNELEKVNRSNIDTLELVIGTFRIAINITSPPDLTTYEELISTGKLNIIRNKEIKSKISRYKRLVDSYGANRDREFSIQITDYKNHLHHFFSALIGQKVFQSPTLRELKELGVNVDAYVTDSETVYHVRNIVVGNERINDSSNSFLESTVNPLILLVREELEKI